MSVFSVILNLILIFILIILYNQYIRIKEKYSREADLNNLLIEISKELMTYKDVNKIFKKILFDTLKIIPQGNAGSILVYNKKMIVWSM